MDNTIQLKEHHATIPYQNGGLKEQMSVLAELTEGLDLEEALSLLAVRFPGEVVFSTSFSIEDQVV
ncbi:MAG TPA: hypothetical protein VNS58_11325, partial [Puia sp.]|nr:hypothetical protein [Puia sp.]